MRARAFAAATAPAVAVIEDHVIVPPAWARQMLVALGTNEQVVGGAVANAATANTPRLGGVSVRVQPLPAAAAGRTRRLAHRQQHGLLRRPCSIAIGPSSKQVTGRIICTTPCVATASRSCCHPEIVVDHKKHYTFGEYFSQRYLYPRSYAGARVAGAPAAKRAAYALASLALPPLLFYRTVTRITRKRQHLDWLAKSLPLIGLFVIAWGWGEVVGSLRGAGDSLGRVC